MSSQLPGPLTSGSAEPTRAQVFPTARVRQKSWLCFGRSRGSQSLRPWQACINGQTECVHSFRLYKTGNIAVASACIASAGKTLAACICMYKTSLVSRFKEPEPYMGSGNSKTVLTTIKPTCSKMIIQESEYYSRRHTRGGTIL